MTANTAAGKALLCDTEGAPVGGESRAENVQSKHWALGGKGRCNFGMLDILQLVVYFATRLHKPCHRCDEIVQFKKIVWENDASFSSTNVKQRGWLQTLLQYNISSCHITIWSLLYFSLMFLCFHYNTTIQSVLRQISLVLFLLVGEFFF